MDSTLTELACQLAPQAVAPMGTIGIWQFLKLPAVKEGLNQSVSPFMQLLALSSKAATNQLIPSELVLYGIADQARSLDNKINFMVKNLQPLAVAIPEENRQEPDPRILKQTLNAVDEVFDEPMLKDMFANLLANAMDTRTSNEVHPKFIKTIKEMSTNEAKLMLYLSQVLIFPFVKIQTRKHESARVLGTHIKTGAKFNLNIETIQVLLASNLLYSTIPLMDYSQAGSSAYASTEESSIWYDETIELLNYDSRYTNCLREGEKLEFIKGTIKLSGFGLDFIKTVMPKSETIEVAQPLETL